MEVVLDLISTYGPWLLFVGTLLSCLALPVPSSVMMLAGGAFAASGDMVLWQIVLAAFSGAVLGDQLGYAIARYAGQRLEGWIRRNPVRAGLREKSARLLDQRGGIGIYFSRWLVSPLGPYVNLACGLTRFDWRRFLVWDILGEITWVGIYVGLGYGFTTKISAIAEIAANASGFLAGAVVSVGLGVWLWQSDPVGKRRAKTHI